MVDAPRTPAELAKLMKQQENIQKYFHGEEIRGEVPDAWKTPEEKEASSTSPVAPIPEPSFSTNGPVCPCCNAKWTTDESHYFDENGYELTCDECGTVFSVQPHASWSWTSRAIKPWGEPGEPPATDLPSLHQLHGTYIGPHPSLKGETALLDASANPELCLVQFDDISLQHIHTHGWTHFLRAHFQLDGDREWPST